MVGVAAARGPTARGKQHGRCAKTMRSRENGVVLEGRSFSAPAADGLERGLHWSEGCGPRHSAGALRTGGQAVFLLVSGFSRRGVAVLVSPVWRRWVLLSARAGQRGVRRGETRCWRGVHTASFSFCASRLLFSSRRGEGCDLETHPMRAREPAGGGLPGWHQSFLLQPPLSAPSPHLQPAHQLADPARTALKV